MITPQLSESERNHLADLVHSRGGDELLLVEVLAWADEVRAAQHALEALLAGNMLPTLDADGRLMLTPLHLTVPAPRAVLVINHAKEQR